MTSGVLAAFNRMMPLSDANRRLSILKGGTTDRACAALRQTPSLPKRRAQRVGLEFQHHFGLHASGECCESGEPSPELLSFWFCGIPENLAGVFPAARRRLRLGRR